METNGTGTENTVCKRNKAMFYALSKRLSLDPKNLPGESITEHNIETFMNILQLSENGSTTKNKNEVMKWVKFASSFPAEAEAFRATLERFNEDLTERSVLLGDGLTPSEADVVVFSVLHSCVTHLSNSELQQLPNVMRWMDYIQNKEDFGHAFGMISVEKTAFTPRVSKVVEKSELDPSAKKSIQGSKNVDKSEVDTKMNSNKVVAEKKAAGDGKASEEKKKVPEKETVEKDTKTSVSLLNIQVGIVRRAWKHPSADSLLVEEIDLGNGNLRQVVSGLAKYCTPEDLTNWRVVLITNVKPGKLRDVMSAGLA